MKKYSRKALIRYFEKLPPRSLPCNKPYPNAFGEIRCPIGVFMREDLWGKSSRYDSRLAHAFDDFDGIGGWRGLTAASIVKIAKELEDA